MFSEGEYLKELTLGEILSEYYGDDKIERQWKIGPYRVDYLVGGSVAVEFDGYHHYSSIKTIKRDILVDGLCSDRGIKVVRVPFFIQYNHIMPTYFDNEYCPRYEGASPYHSGFIDAKALRPSDFNLAGLQRFIREFEGFSSDLKEEVYSTLNSYDIEAIQFVKKKGSFPTLSQLLPVPRS